MLPRVRKILERRFSERLLQEVEEPDFGAPEPAFRDMSEDEMDLWQATSSLEALSLESTISPYLTPMQRRVVRKEEVVLNQPWDPGDTLTEHVHKTLARKLSDDEVAALGPDGVALLGDARPANPFDRRPSVPQGQGQEALMIPTPKPKRPPLARRPQSARPPGEPPLLHQAVRRQHQAALAQSILRDLVPSSRPERPSLLRSGYSLLDDGHGGTFERLVSPKTSPTKGTKTWI